MSRRPPDQSPSYHSGSPKVPLPQLRVVLRHTADQPLMTVVRIIMELTRFGREEATHRMWEAYHRGQSTLLTTHVERAEWFVEAFHRRGLQVVLEKV
jgi:ATP-dependent Clp protease adapter protein ClpS